MHKYTSELLADELGTYHIAAVKNDLKDLQSSKF
jgi:hypothetical protein